MSEREVRNSAPDLSGRVAERLKAHAWRACGRGSVSWVRIPPRPCTREGWQNGNAPHSKCGALTGLWVRIPPPPLLF